jgi:hypothetical protein
MTDEKREQGGERPVSAKPASTGNGVQKDAAEKTPPPQGPTKRWGMGAGREG